MYMYRPNFINIKSGWIKKNNTSSPNHKSNSTGKRLFRGEKSVSEHLLLTRLTVLFPTIVRVVPVGRKKRRSREQAFDL